VKPVVEVMAALPSVVIGFLAGLWLAPVIQNATFTTLLLFPAVPLVVLGGVFVREGLPSNCGSGSQGSGKASRSSS